MGHVHELYDFTASAFIVNNNRVLLVLHKKLGVWLQPGGHVELDEDPEEALFREIKEETGLGRSDLEIVELVKDRRKQGAGNKLLPLPFDFNVHKYDDKHRHIDLCYLAKSETDKVSLEEAGATDIRWFSMSEMKRLLGQKKLYADTYDLSKIAIKHAS